MAETQGSLWIAQELAKGLALAVESMTGSKPESQIAESPGDPAELSDAGTFWWQQPFSHAPEAPIRMGVLEKDWKAIGEAVLTAALVEDIEPAMARDTFRETAAQAFEALAQAISVRLGREVTCGKPTLSAPENPDAAYAIDLRLGGSPARFYFAIPDLLAAVGAAPAEAPRAALAAPPTPGAGSAPPPSTQLDLLLDVQLPVSVSFGQSQLPLKDVLKLTTGSIIELNRTVSEPVEVIVNNCIIARGEVVVVEGNFGVRIQHVVSRQERLRTIQ